MLVIGITGGIGSGKSTVSSYLAEKNYKIIDADEISRKMTEAGSPALPEIRRFFGNGVFHGDGSLDRGKLAAVVFADAGKKKLLERLITDKVILKVSEEIKDLRNSGAYDIIFLDAPLLFETGTEVLTDCVWLVTCDEAVRIRRVAARDGSNEMDVKRRIDAQMSDAEKSARAQEIIDNSKGKEELVSQIESLLGKYVKTT